MLSGVEGVVLSGGGAVQGVVLSITGRKIITPPVDRMTDTSENITLTQTSFADGKNGSSLD